MADRNPASSQWFASSSSKSMAAKHVAIDFSLSGVALAPPISKRPGLGTSLSPRTEQTNTSVCDTDDESIMAAFAIMKFSDEDIYKIKKQLTKSDVDNNCRLLLKKDLVEKYILQSLGKAQVQLCQEKEGLCFQVYDIDDGSVHQLRLKRWENTRYFVLTGGWIPNFVKRKNLEVGDQIGITMIGGCLFFKLLKKKGN